MKKALFLSLFFGLSLGIAGCTPSHHHGKSCGDKSYSSCSKKSCSGCKSCGEKSEKTCPMAAKKSCGCGKAAGSCGGK